MLMMCFKANLFCLCHVVGVWQAEGWACGEGWNSEVVAKPGTTTVESHWRGSDGLFVLQQFNLTEWVLIVVGKQNVNNLSVLSSGEDFETTLVSIGTSSMIVLCHASCRGSGLGMVGPVIRHEPSVFLLQVLRMWTSICAWNWIVTAAICHNFVLLGTLIWCLLPVFYLYIELLWSLD